ncbi:MAG: nucleotidyltransferase domain-containing protein [Planctomycetales bacterium]|nr:nucleotidyltransferase domain-containing protein [bacterium]UNM09002.1 MAG: nucleotidyltransferase domain-containing protein [Planctomycetales bacterium]
MDTNHNEIRLASAGRCVAELSKLPGLRCVLLTGSVAEGLADAASDVDMAVYFDEVPSREQLEEFKQHFGGGDWIFFFGDPAEGGCAISFHIDGIKHDFGIASLEHWKAWMDDIFINHNHESPMQKAASGIVDASVLHGEETAAWLKDYVASYPRELAVKMLQAHLIFFPAWVPLEMAWRRGDILHYQQILVEESNHLLHLLCALNSVYHFGEFKRLSLYEAKFSSGPRDVERRINALFSAAPELAVADLHGMIAEVLAIIEQDWPEVDTARQRFRLSLPQQPAA